MKDTVIKHIDIYYEEFGGECECEIKVKHIVKLLFGDRFYKLTKEQKAIAYECVFAIFDNYGIEDDILDSEGLYNIVYEDSYSEIREQEEEAKKRHLLYWGHGD